MNPTERIRDALQYVPAHDRETWLKMGMAVKSELGDAGFQVWENWSQQAESFDPKAARDVWKGIRPDGGIKAGTLFHEAKANGWRDDGTHPKPTPEDLAEKKRRRAESDAQSEAEERAKHEAAKVEAAEILEAAMGDPATHPYAVTLKNGINLGPRVKRGKWPQRNWPDALLVPIYQPDGKTYSIEAINVDGKKDSLKDGKKAGGFHRFLKITGANRVLIGEGLATVAAAVDADGSPATAVLTRNNLKAVGKMARRLAAPDAEIIILADHDPKPDGTNPGLRAAEEAAAACGGSVAVFGTDSTPCDCWDIWAKGGKEAVNQVLAAARKVGAGDTATDEEPLPGADPESLFDAVTRLAGLHPLEYEKRRETEANALGVRVGVLDKEVGIVRKARQEEGGKAVMFPTVKVWNEAVDANKLLKEIHKTIKQFIICESDAAITATLWIAFTWFVDVVEVAPLAVITAPEKRCGKTQLLNLIGRLSRRPLMAANISPAATFRVIEAHCPTLLIDEADSFLKDNEELRGVINSGHTRQSAYVIRTVGDDHTPQQFSTWGAKAISGIGHLAETLMDRAVILELRRKLPRESVQRLRHAERGLFDRLASQLARFAEDAAQAIGQARPELPEALNDRAQDNWEPLLAIADYAGGEWPRIARDAALKLSGAAQEAKSLSAELLADIQEILKKRTADRISTAELIQALVEDELKPWATYNKGKPISPRQLSKRLGDYGIKSQSVREGRDTAKGFMRNGFDDAFARYLPPPPSHPDLSVTTAQTGAMPDSARVPDVSNYEPCDGTENLSGTRKPLAPEDCDAVTDKFPLPAEEMTEVEF